MMGKLHPKCDRGIIMSYSMQTEIRLSNKNRKEWEGGESSEVRILKEIGSILSLLYVATME